MGRTALRSTALVAGATAALLALAPLAGAAAAPSDSGFFLNDSWDATADRTFMYGRMTDEVLVGDWDGDGTDTVMLRRGNVFHVSNRPRGGDADVIVYGRPGDVVLVGDWDGDGDDTLAVRRGKTYHVTNTLRGGDADRVVTYGRTEDDVLVGDWDGNGTDTFAVRRGKTYHVTNTLRGGDADRVVTYGRAEDEVLVGDWDGDGDDTLAVRRGARYFVNNSLASGPADLTLFYGRADDEVLVGDWNGDRRDTLGVRRPLPEYRSSVVAVTDADIGTSWRPGCPVGPSSLRTVVASHWDNGGNVRTGRLVVHASLADDVADVLQDLYEARFPIHRMVPVAEYGADDDASMAANNTSAFNCRAITGGSSFSEHSYGRAIDVNPLVNPYVSGSTVLPPGGAPYADRSRDVPGMIHAGDEVVRAFAARGWSWGGSWTRPKDYQHFSTTGH